MGQSHLEVGQERKVGPGPGDLLEVQHRRNDSLLEDRCLRQQVAAGAGQNRASGECLATLEANQLGKGNVDPVLPGDVLR